MRKTIAILGASGYIGTRLVTQLAHQGDCAIRVLTRDKRRDQAGAWCPAGVELIEGDVGDVASLSALLVPGCVVINLVYLWGAGEEANLTVIRSLLAACHDVKVARLIHCSTAGVMGRVAGNDADEEDQSVPVDDYGTTKLRIEETIVRSARGHFESVIVRPTSVFGIDGEPLKKLASDLAFGTPWRNYLRSCLFGKRRMNLVPVANVTAALDFLTHHVGPFDGSVFIVSDDDDAQNNFADVERFMMNALGVRDYLWPRLPVPLTALKILLRLMGRNNINPLRNFIPYKLRNMGFKSPVRLIDGLAEYAEWYRRTVLADALTKSEPVISVKSGTQGNHES
jgi:nucleoside-diphosphate-sugar epimerase